MVQAMFRIILFLVMIVAVVPSAVKLPASQPNILILFSDAATAIAAAGGKRANKLPLDGVDLIPFFTGHRTGDPHAALYWRMKARNTWAIRMGDWKLVAHNRWHDHPAAIPKPRLNFLAKDVGEWHDLSTQRPDKLTELQSAYDAWKATLPEPLWSTDESPEAIKARQERIKRQKAKTEAGKAPRE